MHPSQSGQSNADPLSSVTSSSQLICGIALVPQRDNSGFPAYHWALVLCTDYSQRDARVFQIVNYNPNNPATWRKRHKVCALQPAGARIVFHLSKINCALNTARFLIEGLGPLQNGWNTQHRTWSSAMWVLRAVEVMISTRLMPKLPCPLVDIYDKIILAVGRLPESEDLQIIGDWWNTGRVVNDQ